MTNIYLNTYRKISDAIHGHSLFENRPMVDFQIRKPVRYSWMDFWMNFWMNELITTIQIFRPPAPAGPAGLPPRRACPPTCPPSPTHGCTIDFKYNPDCHLLGGEKKKKNEILQNFATICKIKLDHFVDLETCCKMSI